jgi:DinB superfamily
MPTSTLRDLLGEFERALAYTDDLQVGLTPEQIAWRPDPESSAIGWHLGHQPAVAHFMLRNLLAAEPSIDADLDALMDSATPERHRGDLPSLDRIRAYRSEVASRVHDRIGQVDQGAVGAPNQLRLIASTVLIAIVNHEYQHSKWIGELRTDAFGLDLPPLPSSPRLNVIDDYVVLKEPSPVPDP